MNLKGKRFENARLGMELYVYKVDGKEMFIGKDIAEMLGYVNSRDAIKTHVKWSGNKTTIYIKTIENTGKSCNATSKVVNNNLTLIDECGLYQLIFGSNMPKAEEFQSWVCEEVLPSIRKNGFYLEKELTEDQYKALQEELKLRNQQVENFSNMIGGNVKKQQRLETFLTHMFPAIRDAYAQFIAMMVHSGTLDENYNPTELFVKLNRTKNIFIHTTKTTINKESYLALTSTGIVELSKRLFMVDGKIKIRKSEEPRNEKLVLFDI